MKEQVSDSDVVYTFLHCLLRDEQDMLKMREGNFNTSSEANECDLDLLLQRRAPIAVQ